MAGGYCLRTLPKLSHRSLPILAAQRADADALAADAEARGWDQEATRHRRLVERLDQLMNQTDIQ
ncbi:hypothetical protein MGAST_29575 [Mycobacterium gastri 'Wayne']|uniref:Uncharacterized protein n=1 Tax=Mycobacterium gastri TaxID=1777 RepID=A0A1X1VEH8_MYCGS|nr:hypothetical protein MGAST_29575 [Mycobacterium gastri 'Wayne']ORV67454.1 hypothetical protein AWC07_01050 [Mycobacterium gastri]